MAGDCIFCRIVKGELPCAKLFENEQVLTFLDIGPLNPAHTLVIPKQHFTLLDDCPDEVLTAVMHAVAQVGPVVKEVAQADGYNVLNNNGRAAGQVVDHVHFHVIPRHAGDGVLGHWPAKEYAPGQIEQLGEQIRNLLK